MKNVFQFNSESCEKLPELRILVNQKHSGFWSVFLQPITYDLPPRRQAGNLYELASILIPGPIVEEMLAFFM